MLNFMVKTKQMVSFNVFSLELCNTNRFFYITENLQKIPLFGCFFSKNHNVYFYLSSWSRSFLAPEYCWTWYRCQISHPHLIGINFFKLESSTVQHPLYYTVLRSNWNWSYGRTFASTLLVRHKYLDLIFAGSSFIFFLRSALTIFIASVLFF